MHTPHRLDSEIGWAVLAIVAVVVYVVVEIIDRVTASPAMRAHVNDGSKKFFAERGSVWQAALRSALAFLSRFS